MHLQEFAETGSRVDLRGVHLLMTENRLQVAKVGSILEHQRGHRMAEDVTRPALFDTRRLDVAARVLGQ